MKRALIQVEEWLQSFIADQPKWQREIQYTAEQQHHVSLRTLQEAKAAVFFKMNNGDPDGPWQAFKCGNRWYWGNQTRMPEIEVDSADANPEAKLEPQTASDLAPVPRHGTEQFDTGSLLEMSAVKQVVSLGKMSEEQLGTVSGDLDSRMHSIWGKEQISDREGKLADRFEQLLDLINAELERRQPSVPDEDDDAEMVAVPPTPLWKNRDLWQYFSVWPPDARRKRIAQIEAQPGWEQDQDMLDCRNALRANDHGA